MIDRVGRGDVDPFSDWIAEEAPRKPDRDGQDRVEQRERGPARQRTAPPSDPDRAAHDVDRRGQQVRENIESGSRTLPP